MAELRRGVVPATMTDPYADDLTKPFWDAALEERLVVPRCTNCGTFICLICTFRGVEFCRKCEEQRADAQAQRSA